MTDDERDEHLRKQVRLLEELVELLRPRARKRPLRNLPAPSQEDHRDIARRLRRKGIAA